MIVNRFKLPIILLFSLIYAEITAQNTRYRDPVFAEVDISTVNYSDVFNDASHKMDIYQPKGDTAARRPLLVYIHGGAFYAGDKATQDCIDFCTHYAKRGYVAVSVNYRLANALLFLFNTDVQLEAVLKSMADVKSAIRFFGKDAQTDNSYKIDTQSVFVGGYSAGGVCALHTAWVDSESEMDNQLVTIMKKSIKTLDGDAGNIGYPCNIKAVFSLAGALYKTSYASTNDQPAWLGHAKDDGTVNFNCAPALNNPMVLTLCGTGKIYPRLDTVGVAYDTMILSKGDHGWPGLANNGKDFLRAVDEIAAFFYPMLSGATNNSWVAHHPSSRVKLYPNPSQNDLITLDAGEDKLVSMELFDLTGRRVNQVAGNEMNIIRVNVTHLPCSLYKVVVTCKSGLKTTLNFQKI